MKQITKYSCRSFVSLAVLPALALALVAMSSARAEAQCGPSTLVGNWRMEENGGAQVLDSSGNGNTGALSGNPMWVTGMEGSYALSLDGATDGSVDWAQVPDNATLDITSAITMAGWVNPARTSTQAIIRKVDGTGTGTMVCPPSGVCAAYEIITSANHFVSVRFNGDNNKRVDSNYLYDGANLNTWFHVAATYDSAETTPTIRLYINGVLDNSLPLSAFTINSNSIDLTMGGDASGSTDRDFQGLLDDMRLYNCALDASEVYALYNPSATTSTSTTSTTSSSTTSTTLLPDLVGHWQMESDTTGFILDSTIYTNDGALWGDAHVVAGGIGGSNALALDGTGDYALVPHDTTLDITDGITLAACIKPESTVTQYIIKKATQGGTNGYELGLSTTLPARPVFVRFNQASSGNTYRVDSTSSYANDLGTWIHVAATYDGTTTKIYYNGAFENSGAGPAAIATNSLSLGVGAQSDSGSPFQGLMDDARVYNYALDAGTIATLAEPCWMANPVCGDGEVEGTEQCDDGNTDDGDCCSSTCQFEDAGSSCPDDGNVCTDDECDGSGACTHPNNTDPCDDGIYCNGTDTCAGGACTHSGDPCTAGPECNNVCNEVDDDCAVTAGVACTDDGNVCTDDECDGSGACSHPNNTDPCDDGIYCNGTDTCAGGACTHSGDPCTAGPECNNVCDEVDDDCAVTAGVACTDDGNVCTDDECDGAGTCSHPNNTDPCDNGNPNDDPDVCEDGVCVGQGGCQIDEDCNDSNPCTDDDCLPSGACDYTNNTAPCDDGIYCNGTDTCAGGACTHSGDPCTAGPECNNVCNEVDDDCAVTAGVACTDDGNVCTDDECDGNGACSHPNNADPCDDGIYCNGTDTCAGGACTHSGDPCTAGPECNNVCNEVDDDCAVTAGVACTDDGNVCTDDECDGSGACTHPNNTDPCDDGIYCNGTDTCAGGACTHSGDPCTAGLECNNVCDEVDDDCAVTAGVACTDDGNVCTDDECDGAGTCSHPNNTDPCDNGNPNDDPDVCEDGVCVGQGGCQIDEDCNDSNPCTDDDCLPSGACDYTNNTAPCDDGLYCNGTDTCGGGVCTHTGDPCPGTDCNNCNEAADNCLDPAATPCTSDGDICTDDECDGSGTCLHIVDPTNDPSCLPEGLMAHFNMEDISSGYILDETVYENDGLLQGNPTLVPGIDGGQALDLDGSGDYALVPDDPTLDITSAITLVACFKAEKIATQDLIKKDIMSVTDGYNLSLSAASSPGRPNTVFFRLNQATNGNTYRINANTLYPIDGNTWMHAAATYDGTWMRLYINGVEDEIEVAGPPSIATNSLDVGIGAQPDGQRQFQGVLDDVRVYNYALDANAIAALAEPCVLANPVCGDGALDPLEECDEGLDNGTPGSCCESDCTFTLGGTTCRPAAGACDVDETCTGGSGACPADAKSTAECRVSAGVCDPAESCDGVNNDCPADGKSTTECRVSAGVCDPAESCDGVNDDCPADGKSTAECRASAGVCDPAESCDGVNDDCPADGKSTAECRASAGVCDPAESCDGVNDDCPADGKSTAECRASAGVCDPAESCDGVNNDCPADGKSTAECRASAGVCDPAESCDGVNDDCPADGKSTAECRASAGDCDLAESCDGVNDDCPADGKSTAECRASAGDCDLAESCDGVTNDCPVDAFEPDSTPCPDTDGDPMTTAGCDAAGTCDQEHIVVTTTTTTTLLPTTSTTTSTTSTTTTTLPSVGCPATPDLTCETGFARGTLLVNEKATGRERLTAKLIKGPALTQGDFGDPLSLGGTVYDICIYKGDGTLVSQMTVDRAAADCAGKPCWKAIGTKGYLYKDKALGADGIFLMKMIGGPAGRSKALVKGKGANLPAGVAVALQGSTSATVQLIGREAPKCLSVTLDEVKKDDGLIFKALLK